MNTAKNSWIRTVQSKVSVNESQSITTCCASNHVRQFGLHAHECAVLRYKRRIEHANLSTDTVNPVLLPIHHRLTNLMTKEVHSIMMHGGVAST